ncbi:MAG: M1 family aminopeptidase [Emcibacteraceae bacterium]|nr:M1 family aminopeptidase [Emcibacteraceae bacterium]
MKYLSYLLFVILCIISINSNANTSAEIPVVKGVSWELASHRKQSISNINYKLKLDIPELPSLPITSTSEISFDLKDLSQNLQIDFNERTVNIKRILVNGTKHDIVHQNEHIIIEKSRLTLGNNIIKIEYNAGNGALNRTPNFIYTLFVPDRMRTSFPSFDQPNLKATFDLTITIPENWETISSAPIELNQLKNDRRTVRFETSDKISTYLFSFVAGRFNKVVKTIDGRELTMLHREPDEEKAKRNEEEIFRLHKASLDYMEEYTGVKFPFKKFGFALIPSFQFGGMEHVGAIQYKSSTLMLDENPSVTDLLSRAALIGHETAHMWFGDLVTMDWFNDVWTKEVFANFMSAKIVNPSFPEINHQLRSHLRLHPSAYSVDRTEGSNPIRQELPNLNEAGTMYGAIIYNKAPIMMQQLELLLGADNFRDGIREYLTKHAFSNATWPDLIDVLDKRSDQNIKEWSEVWVNTSGRPTFNASNNRLDQVDPDAQGRNWPQSFSIKNDDATAEVTFNENEIDLITTNNTLLNANGLGYGLFPIEKHFIQNNWDNLNDLERAAAWVSLYEQLLEGNGTISPAEYIDLILWAVEREENPLLINHMMRQLTFIYWSLMTQDTRLDVVEGIENILWASVNNPKNETGIKRIYFRTFANIAQSKNGYAITKSVWDKSLEVVDLKLATRDYTNLAATLAIKRPREANDIIRAQIPRINGLDNQRRFEFIKYAITENAKNRDVFFDALLRVENRHTEAWVLSALNYLHHPLRTGYSEKYLKRSLELLQEIQITGDIFFPGRWLSATLRNYQSDSAVKIVRDFLDKRPDYNKQLRMKILQEADELFRANKILKQAS